MRERQQLEKMIGNLHRMEQELNDQVELVEMAEAEGDDELIDEAEATLQGLKDEAEKLQLESLLSGEADGMDAYLEVNAGAGGTEAQDWAQMLLRMYSRWAEKRGFKVEYLQESPGEEAGIKSATIQITGESAYGWLKTETGVHRLVRISPYDSSARRHTSFSAITISPVVDDSIEIEINPADLKTDTFRASGAGGQHVNTTDSAVRITHTPTGTVVECQQERSQHKNRAKAMEMLRAKLYDLELKRREEEAAGIETQKSDIGWGHAIRSYVLHPYQMVKDNRTKVETTDSQGVLNGNLDNFLEAALAARLDGLELVPEDMDEL
ncbi:MAG: peptide chain release factor 2 [Alphaproteobacteria bacterium]